MLFEFCRHTPLGPEYYLLDNISLNNGYIKATMISNRRGDELGKPFYIKNEKSQQFYATGSFTLIEYNGQIKEPTDNNGFRF